VVNGSTAGSLRERRGRRGHPGLQERREGATLVHGRVGLGSVGQRQGEVEDLPRVDLPAQHEVVPATVIAAAAFTTRRTRRPAGR
jgi:hypothetical protein